MPSIPLKTPWDLFPSPVVEETLLVELVDRHADGYQRLEPGFPHPDRSKYPNVVLADEKPVDGSENMVRRYWANDEQAPDTYNWTETFSSESADHPIWARRYMVRRDNAAMVAVYKTAFTGVFLIRVTNGGTGYTIAPAVTLTGGAGSGATAEAIIDEGLGTVAWVKIVTEGTGYTSAPTIGFVGGGGGSGAVAVAVMQGAAKLVHQEVQQLPREDPRFSLWVAVLRVWETLPGPTLLGKYIDVENGRMVTVSERVEENGGEPTDIAGIISSTVTAIDANRSKRKYEVAESFETFEDIPGVTSLQKWFIRQEPRTHADLYNFIALATKGHDLPDIGTVFTFRDIEMEITSRDVKGYTDTEDQWVIEAVPTDMDLLTYVEFVRAGIRFPGLYQFIEQFSVAFTFPYRPPFPGIHDNYLPPRTNTIPARATHYFTRGKPESIPQKFTVLSPGMASKMVPIREDTIHPAFQWFINSDDAVTMVENIRASSPETYDPNEIYIFDVEATRWRGNIYEVTLIEASEGRSISYFPPAQRSAGVTIGPYGNGLEVADYSQTGLFAVNTNAGAKNIRVFGFQGPTWKQINGALPADAALVDLGENVLNTIEYLTGDGISHADGVEVYTYGTAGESTITFSSNPANNDQIKLGFLNGDGTSNSTYTFKTTLTENILATGTLTLVANVSDGDTSSIGPSGSLQTWTFKTTLSENVKATGTLSAVPLSSAAPHGSTVTIGTRTYTFTDPLSNVPNNVYSGANFSASLDNLTAAINAGAGAGTAYGTGTVAHQQVTASSPGADSMVVTAIAGGTTANSIATTTSDDLIAYAAFGLPTLSGGLDTVVNEVLIGATASDTLDNYIAAINGAAGEGTTYSTGTEASEYVTAAAGAGDTMVATSLTGGTAANLILTQETFTNAGNVWGGANLTGGQAAVANEVQRGASATASSQNLQAAINQTGTAGVAYSTGTTANSILVVPDEQASNAFVISTRIAADWESFGSWQTGAEFVWITDANGAFPVNDFGTVGALTGAENGTLVGTLETAEHSLVNNERDFDDPNLKNRNFPPTPDNLVTSVVLVGNREADIYYAQYGGMSITYQKSVDGVTNWVAGDETMPTLAGGQRRRIPIDDFDWNPNTTPDNEKYLYIRFTVTPAAAGIPDTKDYGRGRVSRLYLVVAIDVS